MLPADPPERSLAADLLKGTAILLMIQVHVLELFVRQEVMDSGIGRALLFLGGPPVAPVFLAVMGFYALATPVSLAGLMWRGLRLLTVGLALNLGLNAHLLLRIYWGEIALSPWEYLFGVDVLFAAGWSLVVMAMLRPVLARRGVLWALAALAVAAATPWFAGNLPVEGEWRWLAAYLGSAAHWSYFPLFPWLAYPLLGAAAACLGEGVVSLRRSVLAAAAIGIPVLLATGDFAVATASTLPRYYHHGVDFFIWTALFLAVWTGLHRLLASCLAADSLLPWLGRHVTACYVVQWLLIGNIATAIYKTESLLHGALWYVTLVVLVVAVVRLRDALPTLRRIDNS